MSRAAEEHSSGQMRAFRLVGATLIVWDSKLKNRESNVRNADDEKRPV